MHLDPLGGMAGDMFVAALLDLRPELETGLAQTLAACPLLHGVSFELKPHRDRTLTGRRFVVSRNEQIQPRHHGHHEDGHHHVSWRDIRAAVSASPMNPATVRHATGVFALLAEAEAKVHGVLPDHVHFHEVGAWDSIADIVAAAHLITALDITGCSIAEIPLGAGRVATAHGPLPIPAPATALLLEGFTTIDDGIAGERVTPTGAAILRYLCRTPGMTDNIPRKLTGSGFGFGARELPDISNCLRVLAFDQVEPMAGGSRITVLEFEVDDQTGEDLAEGLEPLRARDDVLDIVQAPVSAKRAA